MYLNHVKGTFFFFLARILSNTPLLMIKMHVSYTVSEFWIVDLVFEKAYLQEDVICGYMNG